jgi:hypothetical protein
MTKGGGRPDATILPFSATQDKTRSGCRAIRFIESISRRFQFSSRALLLAMAQRLGYNDSRWTCSMK